MKVAIHVTDSEKTIGFGTKLWLKIRIDRRPVETTLYSRYAKTRKILRKMAVVSTNVFLLACNIRCCPVAISSYRW
jgi:hypothetical protein